LLSDESGMHHAGALLMNAIIVGCDYLEIYHDKEQIGYTCRLANFTHKYSRLIGNTIIKNKTTYRLPFVMKQVLENIYGDVTIFNKERLGSITIHFEPIGNGLVVNLLNIIF